MSGTSISGSTLPNRIQETKNASPTARSSGEGVSVAEPNRRQAVHESNIPQAPQGSRQNAATNTAAQRPGIDSQRDVSELIGVLTDRKSTPAALASALGNIATINTDSTISAELQSQVKSELERELAVMTPAQRNRLAKRMSSPTVTALHREAKLGIGLASVKDRGEAAKHVRQLAKNLGLLRNLLGVSDPEKSPRKSEQKKARKIIEEFAKQSATGGIVNQGTVEATRLRDMEQHLISRHPDLQNTAEGADHLAKQFGEDIADCHIILEDASGGREWLTPRHLDPTSNRSDANLSHVQEHLTGFVGGDEQKVKLLSQMMNNVTALTGSLENLSYRGGLVASMPDGKEITGTEGEARQTFLLKRNDDDTLSLKIVVHQDLESVETTDGSGEKSTKELYPGQSTFDSEVTIRINEDLSHSVEDASYRLNIKPHGEETAPEQGLPAGRQIPHHVQVAALSKQYGIPPERDFAMLGANPDNVDGIVRGGTAAMRANLQQLNEEGVLSDEQLKVLQGRIEFLEDAKTELERIEAGMVNEKDIPACLERVRNLTSDLRLLQQDLSFKGDVWSDTTPRGWWAELGEGLAAISCSYTEVAAQLEDLASEMEETLDDSRGNLDEVCTGALESRANNALLQSRAATKMYTRRLEALQSQRRRAGNNTDIAGFARLVSMIQERNARIEELNSAYTERGEDLPEFGPGLKSKDKNLEKLAKQMIQKLERGEELPLQHPQLSEIQLVEIAVQHYLQGDGANKAALAGRTREFKKNMVAELRNGDWSPVQHTFQDVAPSGAKQNLSSNITPVCNMPALADDYEGRGVPSHDRGQVAHAVNLAHSELRDSEGKVLFSGVRHGILDATSITGDYLVNHASDEELTSMIENVLSNDPRWEEATEGYHDDGIEVHRAILREPEHADRFASWIREGANLNAARELVVAAVNSDPALRQAALDSTEDDVLTVNLNSVSLVTSSPLAGSIQRNATTERTMQDNQEAALRTLAAMDRVPVEVENDEGEIKRVMITCSVLPFNFGVNGFAIGGSALQRLVSPAVGWDHMDETNRTSLTALLDDLDSDEIGGEAGRVLAHLEGREPDRPLTAGQLAAIAQDSANNSAFADPVKRANAIRTLSAQIKEIFNSKAHRRAGNDPYKMVSRLTLLSHLLGDSTAFNCKSGKDRTGQLDAEVKMLAATLADGDGTNAPPYTTAADPKRKTNFLLNTGNLEMQEKNTGLRGFKLRIAGKKKGKTIATGQMHALGKQFNSPLAKTLYNGDSRLVFS